MTIEGIGNSHSLEWLQKGKSVSLDFQTGKLILNGIKQRIWRFLNPSFAATQDIAVARHIIQNLESIPVGVNSTFIQKAEDIQQFRAGEAFVKKVLSGYSEGYKTVNDCRKSLQKLIHMGKISRDLNIPYNVVKANPEFVEFAVANHLHHRIDKSYLNRGIGVKAIEGKIYLFSRYRNTKSSQLLDWEKLPRDDNNKIQGWELMAYGWQPHEKEKSKTLEPVKIITLKPGEKPEYAVELVTAKPTYDLKNMGLGMFGHSWLRVYEPVKNKQGQLTNQLAVYSIGYNLKNIMVPDVFEFLERDTVTSRTVIDEARFDQAKETIESMLRYVNDPNKNLSPSAKEGIQNWLETHCITCGTFASKLYEDCTGEKIDGRLLLMKVLFPEKLNYQISRISLKSPGWFKAVLDKIKFVTHGYFPSVMADSQMLHASAPAA